MRAPAMMASSPEEKPLKRRGRPPKSHGKLQPRRAPFGGGCSAGKAFTPHVMLINQGEDITSKILSLSEMSSKSVCVLSAHGAISTVTLCLTSDSDGNDNAVYQGSFEIISLQGSCLLSDKAGSGNHAGGLSIIVSTPCGSIFGGSVGGPLIAADPVQVIAGCFNYSLPEEEKEANVVISVIAEIFNYSVPEEEKEANATACQLTDLQATWELDTVPDQLLSPLPEFGWSWIEDAKLGHNVSDLTNGPMVSTRHCVYEDSSRE